MVKSDDNRHGELTQFVFDKAKTECDNGFDGGFYLQYLLEVGRDSEWITEKEYLQGSGTGYEQKDMLVMLVDKEHFKTSDDFGEIENYFGEIARKLID